jgi:hypothetical protein
MHPIVYSLKGASYQAHSLEVGPGIPLRFKVADLIKDAPGDFSEGNISLQYDGQSMQVTGQISITSATGLGSFESFMSMESSGSNLDGIVVLPHASSSVRLAVTNLSGTDALLQVRVNGQIIRSGLVIEPRETRVFTKHDLFHKLPPWASALVTFSTTGTNPNQLAVAGAVVDPISGYSSTLFFTDHGSRSSGLLTGTHFLSGTSDTGSFTAFLSLANSTSAPITVSPSVDYTLAQKNNVAPLPPITLSPYEVRVLDLSNELATQGVTQYLDQDGIELRYDGSPGSLVASLTSIEDSSNLVVDTPLKDPHWQVGNGSHPWRIDDGYESTLYVKNPLDTPASAIIQVFYGEAAFLPDTFHLDPHQTIALNLNTLYAQHKKDIKGHSFPENAIQGRVKWSQVSPGSVLIGRLELTNKRLHYAGSFSCGACDACGQYMNAVAPNPFSLDTNISDSPTQYTVTYNWMDCLTGNQTGPYTLDPSTIYWTSDNSNVMSITTSGNATPAAGGTANIYASTNYTGPAQQNPDGSYNGCSVVPYYQAAQVRVHAPYRVDAIATASQGPVYCAPPNPPNGYLRTVTNQVFDNFGQPYRVQGMTLSDYLQIGRNDLGITSGNTGTGQTDANGQWQDFYSVCSSVCYGAGETDATQVWFLGGLSGVPLPGTSAIQYTCNGITINGH